MVAVTGLEPVYVAGIVLDPAHVVGTGGAIGAVARHLVAEQLDVEAVPAGTFVVNVLGSFVLGLVTFLGAGAGWLLFVGTGACGAFTTFSSFAFETVRLWETGEHGRAVANAAANLLGASLAVGAGWLVATALV